PRPRRRRGVRGLGSCLRARGDGSCGASRRGARRGGRAPRARPQGARDGRGSGRPCSNRASARGARLTGLEGRDQRLRDDLQRPAGELRGPPEPLERLLLRQTLLLHQQPLRPLDRLARRQRLGERLRLLAQRRQLVVPGARRLDRGQQIALAERLDQVAEHARLDGARDELLLAIRGQHHDRDRPRVEDPSRRLDPVEARHLHVEHREIRLLRLRELDRLDPVLRLCADLEPGRLEQGAQVEADDRLVLCDQDPHAGNATSARSPPSSASDSVPPRWARTSAATIDRPVPAGAPMIPFPSSAIASRTSPSRCASSIRTESPPCSSAFWSSSLKTTLSSRRSVSTSWTAAIARIRLTESSSARRGSTASPRACRRNSEATVCRLFFTRWWISCASTPRITARPCSSATAAWWAIDASSARSSSLKGVSRSATSSPIWRRFQRSGVRTACFPARPSGHAILPSSRTSAAPVAETASIVVFTIASSDSSRYSDSDTASEIRARASSSSTRRCACA